MAGILLGADWEPHCYLAIVAPNMLSKYYYRFFYINLRCGVILLPPSDVNPIKRGCSAPARIRVHLPRVLDVREIMQCLLGFSLL